MEKQIHNYEVIVTKAKDEVLIPLENDNVISNPKTFCQINNEHLYVTNKTNTLVFLKFGEQFGKLTKKLGKISFIDVSEPNNLVEYIIEFS